MVTIDEAIIAKLDRDGKHFEVLVEPELAYECREGKIISISKMLAVNTVFLDARKGTKVPEKDIEKAFGTTDVDKITELIVKKGEIQLTTEFRRKKTEEKKRQIVNFISKFAINPQTKLPHPPDRIMNAMDKARVRIDPFESVDQQIDAIIKALKPIIPISIEESSLDIQIPAMYAGKAYGVLKEFTVKKENWLSDGSLYVSISIPAGFKETVFRRINSVTEGNAKIQEV